MYNGVECPYCGCDVEINHDDGYGYAEDECYQQECDDCEKTFIYYTSIIFSYNPEKAECLNGGEHTFIPSITYPRRYTKMYCTQCDKHRQCTHEELQVIMGDMKGGGI